MIPSEPVYGESDSGGGVLASAEKDHTRAPFAAPVSSYREASVQRGTLTPIGASYAMQPVEAPDAEPSPSAAKATYQSARRYAQSAPRDYDRQPRDDRRGGDGYEPRGRAYDDKPRGGYDRAGPSQGDYVVAFGDTLFSIAQRHGMSIAELAEINGLSGPTIHPGQRLRVRGPHYTSASKYKVPPAYEPGNGDRGDTAYGYDDRKAPPAYTDDRSGRYGSYSDYAASKAKPYSEEDGGRDESRRPSPSHAYADRPSYPDKQYEGDRPSRSDAPYYAAKPKNYDRPAYAVKPSRSDTPLYAEKPYAERKPAYTERQAHAGQPEEEDAPREQDHNGRSDERPDEGAEEPRHEPRRPTAKGSYYNYSVKPGDTVADIARRNGLSDRVLAEINDIPPGARLYPGQILRLPKGKGYGWSERRDAGEDQDDRPAERRGRRFDDDRSSQKAPAAGERNLNESEARVAKASVPQDGREPAPPPPPGDVAVTGEPEAKRASGGAPEPIMAAANRDMGPADAQSAGARDCESLLANPGSRSAQTFREPVQGVVTAKFGSKTDGTFNDGIDFSVPKGTPVKAAENGVVAYAGNELPGFGNLVLLRHADGFVTAYAHNDELLVRRCDVVKRGQLISKAGASGKTTQPQLHFELRKDSKPVDPEAFFARS